MNKDNVDHMSLMIAQPDKDMYVFLGVEKWEDSRHVKNLVPNSMYIFKILAFTGPDPENITYSSQNISLQTQPGGMLQVD